MTIDVPRFMISRPADPLPAAARRTGDCEADAPRSAGPLGFDIVRASGARDDRFSATGRDVGRSQRLKESTPAMRLRSSSGGARSVLRERRIDLINPRQDPALEVLRLDAVLFQDGNGLALRTPVLQ